MVKSAASVPSSSTKLKPAAKRHRLLSYDEILEWYQENQHIRHGYRPVSGLVKASLASCMYMHNETVNIYSHLLAAVASVLAMCYLSHYLHDHYPKVTKSDQIIFAFFLLTATICLGLSTTYHTFMNHSFALETICLHLDFVGIIFLTLGDFVSGIYMVFWCEPFQRKIYWTMILTLGALTIFVMVNPRFQGRHWRTFRTSCFVGTGISGFVPLAHGVYVFGWSQMRAQSGMPYYLAEGAFLCLGALVYSLRIPESMRPGTFDIYGASHQIFHLLVVLATATQLVGLLSTFDYNYHHRTCLSWY